MRSSTTRPRPRPAAALAPLLGALLLGAASSGCDSPACVFSAEGCTTDSTPTGALGSAPAALPSAGSWIVPTAPELREALPSGGTVDPRTPVVLRFTESLSEDSLAGAFQLRTFDTGAGSIPLPTQTVLVGDGRLVVLVPNATMPLGTAMEVILTADANVTDLTGQRITTVGGSVLASFTTANAQSDVPSIVATYPPDGAFDQSELGEVVVVFDRDMDEGTVDDASFVVTVDGADPVFDPAPTTASGIELFGISQPIPSVYVWRAVDGAGVPQPLGREVEVAVELSPVGEEITDLDGNAFANTTFDHRTASVLGPSPIRITSTPGDGIGIDNLTPGSGNELLMEVDVDGAEAGDRLDLYVFGADPNSPADLIALRRTFDFVDAGPVAIAELLRDGLELTSSTAPLVPRLADGTLAFAAAFTSGPITTPVALFDADAATPGAQGATLDTTAPTFVLFDRTPTVTAYPFDAGDVVFEGVASEALRGIEVSTALATHPVGAQAFSNGTRFASEPLELGVVPPASAPLPYSVVGFDRVGNRTEVPVTGSLTLRGFVSDTPFVPGGGTIAVEVFDAHTLEPLEGAVVLSHAVPTGGGAPTFQQAVSTGADGAGAVLGHGAGDAGTILTAVLDGYDLTSLHLFGSARVSIPLVPTGADDATLNGSLASTTPNVQSALAIGELVYLDGRADGGLAAPIEGGVCTTTPFGTPTTTCPFGPVSVAARRSGSVAAFNGIFDVDQAQFFALTFLTNYQLAFPVGPVAGGSTQVIPFTVDQLLADPAVPAGQGALDVGTLTFDATGATGLDTGSLDDDAALRGPVRVWVEGDLGGSAAPIPAGLGVSYDAGVDTWTLRGALVGSLVTGLATAFDPTQRLAVVGELRDTAGAFVRRRATLADIALGGTTLVAPAAPAITAPTAGTDVGSGAFTVEVANTLVDGAFGGTLGSGLYHLRLEDAAGRGWNHWRPDTADTDGDVVFAVPDPADAGATGLGSGALTARAQAVAIEGFDPLGFYFTDVVTEPVTHAGGAPVVLSIP